MATQSQGIQQLLAAEKKAADIVAEARKRRTRRLKQAKEEAVVEVEQFKSEKERAFKSLEQQTLGSRSTTEDSTKVQTDKMIIEITRLYQQNSDKVLQDVLAGVMNVEAKKHENLIIS